MKRMPGITLSVVLLASLLSVGIVYSWDNRLLVPVGLILGVLVAHLALRAMRGLAQFYRYRGAHRYFDREKAIGRLMKSLTSRDKEEAKRAARLLGELTSQHTALGRGILPKNGTTSWEHWDQWWVENHQSSELKEDTSW